jgi:hypothetical protein
MTLKHPRVLPALSEFGIFYPITTAPPDLAPAHNHSISLAIQRQMNRTVVLAREATGTV